MAAPEALQDGNVSQEQSPWDVLYGPFYSSDAITARGLDPEDLIEVVTTDNVKLYSHLQFVETDGIISPQKALSDFWAQYVKPAIDEGVLDGWAGLGLLFTRNAIGFTNADILSSAVVTEQEKQEVILKLRSFIQRLSH